MKKIVLILMITMVLVTGGYVAIMGWDSGIGQKHIVETVTDQTKKEDSSQGLDVRAKGAVLMDNSSGEVIYEKNSHKELPLASVTKVMTMLLAMENIDGGKLKLNEEVTISENSASMGGSQMFMEQGETHKVSELLKGIAIASANDACVALAEHISGTTEIFVEQMNAKAKEIGMRDTHFQNTNGLPVANHYCSAYDIALMSKELLKYEEPREWFKTWQTDIKIGLPGKEKPFTLTNTNKLLRQYSGTIGIKTGFTEEAGYCISAAAEKNGTTLIAVVLGSESADIRNQEIKKLFDFGFSKYKTEVVAKKGQKLAKIKLMKANIEEMYLVADQDVKASYNKDNSGKLTSKVVIKKNISLPIKKGEILGKVILYKGDQKICTYPLTAEKSASHISFKELYIRIVEKLAVNS